MKETLTRCIPLMQGRDIGALLPTRYSKKSEIISRKFSLSDRRHGDEAVIKPVAAALQTNLDEQQGLIQDLETSDTSLPSLTLHSRLSRCMIGS